MPITTSKSPVAPLISLAGFAWVFMIVHSVPSQAVSGQAVSGPPFRRRLQLRRRLLDDARDSEQGLFIERATDQLQTERQPFARNPGGNGDAGQASHVHRNRED